jgi:hypothetical protein
MKLTIKIEDGGRDSKYQIKFKRGDSNNTIYMFNSLDELEHLHKEIHAFVRREKTLERHKEYQVTDVSSVKEFLERYYKPDRYQECPDVILESKTQDIKRDGYCIISRHDSMTGEVVAYFG